MLVNFVTTQISPFLVETCCVLWVFVVLLSVRYDETFLEEVMSGTVTTPAVVTGEKFTLEDVQVWWELFKKPENLYRMSDMEHISAFLSNVDYKNMLGSSIFETFTTFVQTEIMNSLEGFIDDSDPENVTHRGTRLECQVEILSNTALTEDFYNFFFHPRNISKYPPTLFGYALTSGNPNINADHLTTAFDNFSDNETTLYGIATHGKLTAELSEKVYNIAVKNYRKNPTANRNIIVALCRNENTTGEVLHHMVTSHISEPDRVEKLVALTSPNLSPRTVEWGIPLDGEKSKFTVQQKVAITRSPACSPQHLHVLAYDEDEKVRSAARLELRRRAETLTPTKRK